MYIHNIFTCIVIPLETTDLFSITRLVFLRTLYKWNHTIYNLLRLIFSLSIMPLRPIHVVARINTLFLFIAEQYFVVWMLQFV